ncbi:MAG: DNA primase [Candidatus Magasanikbacteria bacterium]
MNEIEQIKEKIDIADLIAEYAQLKPSGTQLKACCPFHHEKTASFMVSRERQRYHCFGCGEDGDIFTFIQKIEGMEFIESLKHLAQKAGVVLEQKKDDFNKSEKIRIKEINLEAARFYHNFLLKMESSKVAMEYLQKRGLKMETITLWQIGFISEQWDLLTRYLLKKGFSIDDLVKSGLTIKRDNANTKTMQGFYDRFRGRIMFPIRNEHGDVVGFTGRVLVETEKSGGKYVNTPQTPVYDKSRVVFGLYNAKKEIRENDLIVLTEGQMDVIGTSQAGMKNVVASSGTALTEEHIRLLKRYSSNIAMAFDMDDAGIKAAKRGIEIALAEGMNVHIIRIPDGAGKDPDECVQKNPDIWFEAVGNADDVMVWILEMALRKRDMKYPKDKQAVVDDVLPYILKIPYAVERDHWMKELASRVGVDTSVLREDMKRFEKKDVFSPVHEKNEPKLIKKQEKTRYDLLIERFFECLFQFPHILEGRWALLGRIDLALSTSRYSSLYKAIKAQYNNNNKFDVEVFRHEIANSEQLAKFTEVLLMKAELDFATYTDEMVNKELGNLVEQIREEWKGKRRRELEQELGVAEKQNDTVRLQELLEELRIIMS